MNGGRGNDDLVLVGVADRIATVRLNRPERHNSLVPELLTALCDALIEINQRHDVGVLVIRANGQSFSTGGDLAAFGREKNGMTAYSDRLVGQLNEAIVRIAELDLPTIAAVDGQVTGGSIGIVLACDLIIVTDNATFAPWYADIGFSPDGGWTAMLPTAIGSKRALAVQLLNEPVSADQAVAWGLAFFKTDSASLDHEVLAICRRLLAKKSGSLSATKQLMRQVALREALENERRKFVKHIATREAVDGIREFLRRRR